MIVGFRRDQEHTIDGDEAHKAYYLFLHPEERGIFSNGLAIRGEDIQEIVPDYQATMGWNPTHSLDSDDWNEIRDKQVDVKVRMILNAAKEIASLGSPQDLNKPMSLLVKEKFPYLAENTGRREGKLKQIGQILQN